jgi:hypothetical protein
MTDTLLNPKKVKKQSLPLGWIERFSKKYPNRYFYFNEITGESRWSPPNSQSHSEVRYSIIHFLELLFFSTIKLALIYITFKVMESERKRKKRKNSDKESDESSNETISNNVLNENISKRPKLKPRTSRVIHNEEKELSNDTPAMRLYREKLAQRKIALEAKKNTPKTSMQKQNKMSTPPKIASQATSSPLISQTQRRSRRTCSALFNESILSNSSNVSNTSIIETKIAEPSPVVKIPKRSTRSLVPTSINKLPKIPKTHLQKTNAASPKSNFSCNTSIESNLSNKSLVAINKRRTSLRKSIKKNLSSEGLQNFKSTSNKSLIDDKNIVRTPTKPLQKNLSNKKSESFINSLSNETSLDDCNTINSPKTSIHKNLANDRLTNLRRSLNSEKDKGNSPTYSHGQSSINIVNNSSEDKSKLFNQPSPLLYKNAHARLYSLENRVRNSCLLEINKSKQERLNEEENVKTKRILDKIEVADVYCEQMEWEPIEDERIMSEVS